MKKKASERSADLRTQPEYINAKWLVENELKEKTLAAFARKVGKSAQQVNRFLNGNPTIAIGKTVRQDIEEAFGKPLGWLAEIHPHTQRVLTNLGIKVPLSGMTSQSANDHEAFRVAPPDRRHVDLQELNCLLRTLDTRYAKSRLTVGLPHDAVDHPDVHALFGHVGRGAYYTLIDAGETHAVTAQRLYGTEATADVSFPDGTDLIDEASALFDAGSLVQLHHVHIVQVNIIDDNGIEAHGIFGVENYMEYMELIRAVQTTPLEKAAAYRL